MAALQAAASFPPYAYSGVASVPSPMPYKANTCTPFSSAYSHFVDSSRYCPELSISSSSRRFRRFHSDRLRSGRQYFPRTDAFSPALSAALFSASALLLCDKSLHSHNLPFLSVITVAGGIAEIECVDSKKRRPGITSKTALFCCGSERTLYGETAAEEIGVRPIPV